MSVEGFMPLSAQLGIPGSSYRVQLGKVQDKWAVRLAKGNDVLDSRVFHDKSGDNAPNANEIVAWVLQVLPIPNLNPYQIAKSVGFIRQEAIRRNEEAKNKPAASLEEAKKVKLESVAEGDKSQSVSGKKKYGWVKEDTSPVNAQAASGQPASSAPFTGQSQKRRVLPSIPTGNSSGASTSTMTSKGAIKCSSCGAEIKYCPYCGKPLNQH